MLRASPVVATGCPDILNPPILLPEEERPEWLRGALEEEARRDQRARRSGKRPPDDPELLRLVTISRTFKMRIGDPQEGTVRISGPTECLRQIADQTHIPIAADYDPGYDDPYERRFFSQLKADLVNIPLWKALDTIADTWDLRWSKKNAWLQIRSPRVVGAAAGEYDLAPPWEPQVDGNPR
jgi:hypothetical protein